MCIKCSKNVLWNSMIKSYQKQGAERRKYSTPRLASFGCVTQLTTTGSGASTEGYVAPAMMCVGPPIAMTCSIP